ncbi:MAG: DUF1015 domain-containing protein [Peptostreptococcaceae bacterium]|nr:DUF1015 domain-containing protein [Peptostreptococcaceae bacterium]
MARFKPFKGVRPKVGLADKVATLPYDVMNRKEAKKMAEGNEYSFLHIARSEIDLDDSVDPYDEIVYKTARKNLDSMLESGILIQDKEPKLYIYRQIMWGRVQTGIVGCTSIDDYLNDIIRKHELTRVEKEIDRINNFDYCDAHTEPVLLTYRKNEQINSTINNWVKFNKPVYNFTTDDGITHIVWDINDASVIKTIEEIFESMDYLYIADGHHRSASSVKVGLKRREDAGHYSGCEEFNYFLAVAFPDEDLYIMDYNRLVTDLNGYTTEQFLTKIRENFSAEESVGQYKPKEKHSYGMYLEGKWYKLTAKRGTYDCDNVIERLDASILQNNLLGPILGIQDPRTDKRIDFVGGIRGLEELKKRVDQDMKVAFAMYPTTIEDLISVADAGMIMPPKSTWFEPKLRSGLFVHRFF